MISASNYDNLDYIIKKYPKTYSQISLYNEENFFLSLSSTKKSTKHSIVDNVNYYAYNDIWENYNFSDLEELYIYLKENGNAKKARSIQSFDGNLKEENLCKHFDLSDVKSEVYYIIKSINDKFEEDDLQLHFLAIAKNISELALNSENSNKYNEYSTISAVVQIIYNHINTTLNFYKQNDLLSYDEMVDNIDRHIKYLKNCFDSIPYDNAILVFDEELSAFFFHEVVGHLMEAELSELSSNTLYSFLGRKVSTSQLNVFDDGTLSRYGMTRVFDDEGIKFQNTKLISNGVVSKMLFSRNCGLKINEQPTGNGRKSAFHFRPRTRMTNIRVSEGENDINDIISDIDKGLLCVGCNSASSSLQMFNLFPKEVYRIEKGKITGALKPIVIQGNPIKALNSITEIGNRCKTFDIFCKKYAEQPLLMTSTAPAIMLKDMIIRRLY